jgi:hypothetical protein
MYVNPNIASFRLGFGVTLIASQKQPVQFQQLYVIKL